MTPRSLTARLFAGMLAAAASGVPANAQNAFSLAPAPGTESAAAGTATLKPIAADSRDLFFNGESSFREFAFFALPEETTGDIKLMLTMQSAISNTPEQSRMTVFVNDIELGTVQLASGEPRAIELPVQPGTIQPGFNAVTFLADQFHRVDCSVSATYELWTQIDPQKSGFAFSARPKERSDLADLAAIARTGSGSTPIRAIMPAGAPLQTADLLIEAIEAVSVAAHFDHPQVEFASQPGTGPGVDIVLGSPDVVRNLFGDAVVALPDIPAIVVAGAPEEDRMRLIVLGRTTEEIRQQILTLRSRTGGAEPRGTGPGLRAFGKLEGRELQPGSNVGLADLGVDMRTFTGRFFRQSVNFSMPNDFYPGDYGRASIRLNALYAAGLKKGAELLIKLNDLTVSNISLGASRDGVIDEQQLPIPFSAFRPGENTLSIEALLPAPSDDVCDPTQIGGGSGRLRILPDSYLEVPDYARIGRYPDLATLEASLREFARRDNAAPIAILVPPSDPSAMNAAATFLAKLAYASGTVFDTEIVSSMPSDLSRPVIAFGSFNSLPFDLLREMNINFSLAPNLSDARVSAAFAVPDQRPFAADGLGMAPPRPPSQPAPARLFGTVAGALTEIRDGTVEFVGDMRDLAFQVAGVFGAAAPEVSATQSEPSFSPSINAALVIAQRKNPAGTATWTVVATPQSGNLAEAVSVLTHRSIWRRLGGSIMSIADSGEIVDSLQPKDTTLFLTQPSTVTNSRLVIAGWLSNHSDKYVAAVMGVFGLLGLFTHLLLRGGRGRHK